MCSEKTYPRFTHAWINLCLGRCHLFRSEAGDTLTIQIHCHVRLLAASIVVSIDRIYRVALTIAAAYDRRLESTPVRQPNLATSPTHTNINRHSQESRLFLRPTYANGPAGVELYCPSAYYHLRTINNIRQLLTLDACHAAVRSIVLSRVDYCNALLGGLNNRQSDRLQRVQNSAARVIYRVRQHEHITPTLRTLHWIPIRMRTIFKICTYMFKAIHD